MEPISAAIMAALTVGVPWVGSFRAKQKRIDDRAKQLGCDDLNSIDADDDDSRHGRRRR